MNDGRRTFICENPNHRGGKMRMTPAEYEAAARAGLVFCQACRVAGKRPSKVLNRRYA